MILKSYLAEQNFQQLTKADSILMYGENDGIKEDFKKEFKINAKDTEIFNFFQSEILFDEKIFLEEINNQSLFTKKKIFFLYDISDKCFDIIEEIVSNSLEGVKIVVFSGILETKSKLRKFFEKDNKALAIPCYADDIRTLNKYVNNKLKGYKNVSPEVVNLIIENSNLNRRIINSELTKIMTFFKNKELNTKELKRLLNVKITEKFEEIRDACLSKKKSRLNKLIGTNQFLDEDIFFYLIQIASRVRKLIELKQIDKNIDYAMEHVKPKVFWKDKPIFIEQSAKWNNIELSKILKEIGNTEILMKKKSYIQKNLLMKNLLINICSNNSNVF